MDTAFRFRTPFRVGGKHGYEKWLWKVRKEGFPFVRASRPSFTSSLVPLYLSQILIWVQVKIIRSNSSRMVEVTDVGPQLRNDGHTFRSEVLALLAEIEGSQKESNSSGWVLEAR